MIYKHSLEKLREIIFSFQYKRFAFIKDWKKNPYSSLKARFYMETSVILVFFLLKTSIKPNTVTILYGLAGILGGILLAIPHTSTILIAIIIFFTKGVLDWSDGHLARITGQTSLTGHILDTFGAQLNSLGLQVGLGFYVAHKSNIVWFYYLIPLIPFFYATNLVHYSRSVLSYPNIVSDQFKLFSHKQKTKVFSVYNKKQKMIKFVKPLIGSVLDDRARSVDFICLIILLEIFFGFFWSWIIFVILVLKQLLIFLGAFYAVAGASMAESLSDEISLEIDKLNNKSKII
jgi:phosphatidylglycerophosphate synthase